MQYKQGIESPVAISTYVLDILALAILSNALVNLLMLNETVLPDFSQQGSILLRWLNTLVYVMYGLRLALNRNVRHKLRHLATTDRLFWLPVAALLMAALASSLWSSEPQVALRRAAGFAGTTMVGVFLALRYPPRQFLTLLLAMSAVFAIASLAMVFAWPEKGIMHASTVFFDLHQGRWRGVFLHKNRLGHLMAVGIVIAAGVFTGRGKRSLAAGMILLLCMSLLLRTESLTALLASAAALLVVAIVRLLSHRATDLRERLLALVPLLLLSLSAGVHQLTYHQQDAVNTEVSDVVHNTATVVPVSGADTSRTMDNKQINNSLVIPPREGFRRARGTTGRLNMWRLCWDAIRLQPVLGYGYGTFWRTGGPAEMVWKRASFHMPHAHNGWVDLALQLGIPLTLLGAGWMLWLGARLLRWVLSSSERESLTMANTLLGLWVCLNVVNLAESVLFLQHEILSALIVTVAVFASLAASPLPTVDPEPASLTTNPQMKSDATYAP